VPFVASAPLQAPEAEQAVAFVDIQLSVDALPAVMLEGLAASTTVGAGTLTTTLAVEGWLIPPTPVHVSVKAVSPLSTPLSRLPLVASGPVHPPEAVQLLAP
jgi:hypothetical protein